MQGYSLEEIEEKIAETIKFIIPIAVFAGPNFVNALIETILMVAESLSPEQKDRLALIEPHKYIVAPETSQSPSNYNLQKKRNC
jgi:hypothetical protein